MVVEVVEVARRVADQVLLPASDALDRSPTPPVAQLQALADGRLFGLVGPVAAGGWDCDVATSCRVVEILAGACLTTTFIWIQHHAVMCAVRRASDQLSSRYLKDLCSGRRRGGVVLAGLRPGPSSLHAREGSVDLSAVCDTNLHHPQRGRHAPEAWSLSGTVPWFTGWGQVDVALVTTSRPTTRP